MTTTSGLQSYAKGPFSPHFDNNKNKYSKKCFSISIKNANALIWEQ